MAKVSNTAPKTIVDKNGKKTTVHAKTDHGSGTKNTRATIAPVKSNEDNERDLLADVNSEIVRLKRELEETSKRLEPLVAKSRSLNEEYRGLIDTKLELERHLYTADAPIEKLQELNRIAAYSNVAHEIERDWIKSIHPKFRSDLYDTENDVPLITLSFNEGEEIDGALPAAMERFALLVPNDSECVSFHLLERTCGEFGAYHIEVAVNEREEGTEPMGRLIGPGHWENSERYSPLREVLEYVVKNHPL